VWNRRRRRSPATRLPQVVLASGDPPLSVRVPADVDELAVRHRAALDRGNHGDRADALWGLVAHGQGAASWCTQALVADDEDVVEDAAGVLAWIGTPASIVPLLLQRFHDLPGGQARDAIVAALPADARGSVFAEDDAAATEDDGAPFGRRHEEMTEVWFVEASYDDTVPAYREWMAGIDPECRLSEHRGALDALLCRLKPPVKPAGKTLLVETASPWTAVFEQSGTGADWVPHLAHVLRKRALRTSCSVHTTDESGSVSSYGDVAFWLFDGARDDLPLNEIRVIQANRGDAGWTWWLSGEPQPFENLDRYDEKRVPRRFDRNLLVEYCLALGIRDATESSPLTRARSRRASKCRRTRALRARRRGSRRTTGRLDWSATTASSHHPPAQGRTAA
jgi:hypothetical protein